MEITFADRKIRKLCEQQAEALKTLGKPCSRKLRSRLADLAAVENVRALVAGRPHPLIGDRLGEFALDLYGGKRIVFKPANDPIPRLADNSIDWSNITRVCITFIGDYHD